MCTFDKMFPPVVYPLLGISLLVCLSSFHVSGVCRSSNYKCYFWRNEPAVCSRIWLYLPVIGPVNLQILQKRRRERERGCIKCCSMVSDQSMSRSLSLVLSMFCTIENLALGVKFILISPHSERDVLAQYIQTQIINDNIFIHFSITHNVCTNNCCI